MSELPACFKAYDVRGRVPDELDEDLAWRIGRAYAQFLNARRVAVGRDMRLSSDGIAEALIRGLTESGVDVLDIGLGGTEEVYYATFSEQLDGGIMVTASHNPADYNGMKMVREEARPISADTGLQDIARLALAGDFRKAERQGQVEQRSLRERYAKYLVGLVDQASLKPLKLVINAGNGVAGLVADALEPLLPFELIKLQHEPDGTFPNGVPNPMIEENRRVTAEAVREHGADFGIAWDGDFDRCFLWDETGVFLEGYYVVGLLAEAMLQREAGAAIVHDPRVTWNTLDIVAAGGGQPVNSKSGHAFIKQTMREHNALYGGEMSAHHYFRDFSYCDNGNLPWLLVAQLVSQRGKTLSSMVAERMAAYPTSGEINRELADPDRAIAHVEQHYAAHEPQIDYTDGLSVEFADWRFNLRKSNTEPVVRLNVETRGDGELLKARTDELLELLAAA